MQGKPMDQSQTQIRGLSKICEFPADFLEFQIMVKIVIGSNSSRLRRQALKSPKTKLKRFNNI